MKKLYFETKVNGNYKDVFARFDVDLLKTLKPPGVNLEVLRFDGSQKGNEVHLKIDQLGITTYWVSLITEDKVDDQECYFIDEGSKLPPPLKSWRHKHIVRKIDEVSCLIIDDITYTCHGGFIPENVMWPILWVQFSSREAGYKRFFSSDQS